MVVATSTLRRLGGAWEVGARRASSAVVVVIGLLAAANVFVWHDGLWGPGPELRHIGRKEKDNTKGLVIT